MKHIYILSSILALTACGTLLNGSSQDIYFDANVKGVQIIIDGINICKTPCTFTMERRGSPLTIQARKEGYEDQVSVLKSELDKKSLFNTLSWPVWFTDLFTGGMWRYNRSGVYIEMKPLQRPQPIYNNGGGYYYYGRYSEQNLRDSAARRFSLYNYGELKSEAISGQSGEYLKALAQLSGKDENELIGIINKATNEVNLAHTLTGIE